MIYDTSVFFFLIHPLLSDFFQNFLFCFFPFFPSSVYSLSWCCRRSQAMWTHIRSKRMSYRFHWWASSPFDCFPFHSIPGLVVCALRYLDVPTKVLARAIDLCFHLRWHYVMISFSDGPISYSMFDGQHKGPFGDLIDDTYDGQRENGFLSGGLGQLTDGIRGDENYKVNKGFEWIGWRNSTHNPLSITFEFANIRNFSKASFHCNNIFTKQMRVLEYARIYFSLDGHRWSQVPQEFAYMPDMVLEKARDEVIHLHHRIGRFIKFELYFAAKWLLISEVRLSTFSQTIVNTITSFISGCLRISFCSPRTLDQ